MAGKPILAVKVDNTKSAQPHTGVNYADIVYVQQVEGQMSRLLALFSSKIPNTVSPVRSARISDIDLLASFGNVAFAYSGAQSKLLPELADASLLDLSPSKTPRLWTRETWRPVSWINLALDAKAAIESAPETARADTSGFQFTYRAPAGGSPVSSVHYNFGASSVQFTWNVRTQAWTVALNGSESTTTSGNPLTAATVVIQYVNQTESGYGDRYGGKTPLIESVGSGKALVFRNGHMWKTTWERPTRADHTVYRDARGDVLPFAIGQQWIILAPAPSATVINR